MKQNGYQIVSECIDGELPTRPIDTLDKKTITQAENTSKEYTAKATKDPNPKEVKSSTEKGQAAGLPAKASNKKD